jgi:hypothetical protein
MKISARSPFIWFSAAILSGLLYIGASHLFLQTFPLIHLSITMNLEQAIDKAHEIAELHHFGPDNYDYAAMFHTDSTVKTFVELEAGGKDAFIQMMDEKLYMPYTWRVRHFKEHEKNESFIIFTPDGQPYGFLETISENMAGAQLSHQQARVIAESDATADWNINFADYTLVETSQKTEPSGRIDHTLVYEHAHKKIGEGLYRLKIVISGNKMTELTHFVKVPEAFTRRYAEMRSANTTIAWAANLLMRLLYIIGGCCFGLYWIIKQRWYILKQPLVWAIILAATTVLTSINQLPVLWMHYNTAHASHGFLMQLLLQLIIMFIAQTAFFTVIITAAESLTRRAFGNHPQLWSVWQSSASTSYAILGRTLIGYIFVGFIYAFIIAFYALTTNYLHWWMPSEMLFDPNVLATYAPWFSPLAQSLNAGFIEECLFRAIPLAGAALLGNHYGKRTWFIGAALLLQAIVFGAAHANYPMQPSYARIIELFIPSLLWGITYLRLGLLPTIIAHYVYDVIWFSLPIFIAQTEHAYAYKIMIIVGILIPLFIILYARIKQKTWIQLSPTLRNAAWQPEAIVEDEDEKTAHFTHIDEQQNFPRHRAKQIITLGIVGLIIWIIATPLTHDGITITVPRDTAINAANIYLQEKNITLTQQWKTLPLLFTHYKTVPHINMHHTFIWREEGKSHYHNLLGTYLNPAHWTIRYAQFDADIIERAEEYKIMLYNNSVWRYAHQLPESSAGAQLTQEQARTIAHDAVAQQFNLDAAALTEISATQTQLPHRSNWLFIFADPAISLTSGQARVTISIAGDKVVDAVRSVHVPEEWERNEQNRVNVLTIIMLVLSLLCLAGIVCGIIIAARRKIHYVAVSNKLFFPLYGIFTTVLGLEALNGWPLVVGAFNTSLPLQNQLFQCITSLGLHILIQSALYVAVIKYIMTYPKKQGLPFNKSSMSVGVCLGLFFAGIISLVHKYVPSNLPLWPDYAPLGATVPLCSSLVQSITSYLTITIALFLLYILIDRATQQWRMHRALFTIIMTLCCMEIINLSSLALLPLWIVASITCSLLSIGAYRFILRYDSTLIPLATGSYVILNIAQQGIFNAYPMANVAAGINSVVIIVLAYGWYWYMNKQ